MAALKELDVRSTSSMVRLIHSESINIGDSFDDDMADLYYYVSIRSSEKLLFNQGGGWVLWLSGLESARDSDFCVLCANKKNQTKLVKVTNKMICSSLPV